MRNKKIRSIYGSPYERYFENGTPDSAGDLIGGGIGLPTYRNDWCDTRDLWTYPYYNLNMMLGDGVGSYRNENDFTCELSTGAFFFTFPDLKCQFSPAKGEHWGELYASFAGELFEFIREKGILNPAQPVWRLTKPEPWVERLQEILHMPMPVTVVQTTYRAVHFLDFLLELLGEAQPVQASRPDSDWFASACKMLTNDLHHKVDWQYIADELGMSYHTFRFYFAKRAGMPPARYRNQERIRVACDYLTNDVHKSCREIAFELGYIDSHHFSEHFKKHIKMKPTEYRSKHAKLRKFPVTSS